MLAGTAAAVRGDETVPNAELQGADHAVRLLERFFAQGALSTLAEVPLVLDASYVETGWNVRGRLTGVHGPEWRALHCTRSSVLERLGCRVTPLKVKSHQDKTGFLPGALEPHTIANTIVDRMAELFGEKQQVPHSTTADLKRFDQLVGVILRRLATIEGIHPLQLKGF